MSEENVLYVRQEKGNAHSGDDHDSVWDDTLLIRAYDKAVNSAKQKLVSITSRNNDESNVDSSSVVEEEGNSPKRKKKHESKKFQRPWKVGNSCRAVYSVDGEEYEAEIIKMLPNVKSCIVKFYGYGNEEQVSLGDLLPSLGKEEIQLQKQCAEEDKASWCVGDVCRAVFSGDGLEYEAEIIKIYAGSNLALIRYVGYGNQEKVPLHDLIPSRGVQEVELQIVKAHAEYAAKSGSRFTVTPVTLKSNSKSCGKGPQNGYTSPTMMMPPPPVTTNSFMDTAAMGPLQPPIFPGIPQLNNESRLTVTSVASKSNSRLCGRGLQKKCSLHRLMMMPSPPPPPNSYTDIADMDSSQVQIFPGLPQINTHMGNIPLPVLAPPAIEMMLHSPHTETEALTAMLMSWYMSGYHTGYYQGLKHAHMSSGDTNSTDRKSDTIPGKSRNSPPHHHKHHH